MKIFNAKDVQDNEKLKIMLYGVSGSGKTKLMGTLKEKILVLNADRGLLTLSGADIDYVTVNSWKEVIEFLDYIKTKECAEKYSWIGFDTVTAMFDLLTAHLEKKALMDSKFDGFAFYKEYGGLLLNFLRIVRDQNTFNVLALFQHSTKEDKNGLSQQVFGFVGSNATRAPEFFDEVFCLRSDKEGNRIVHTAPIPGFVCKDRSQTLEKTEKADLSLIMKKIKGQ